MSAEEYLYAQMELEGIRVSAGNLIQRIHPEVEFFPLVVLAAFHDGRNLGFFDDMLPSELLKNQTKRDLGERDINKITKEFETCDVKTKANRFRTYTFPGHFADIEAVNVKCLHSDDPKVLDFGFGGLGEHVYAIELHGKIISACVSSRENEKAAESWVYTAPENRGHGLALQVVTAWAGSVLKDGKIPFYSHAIDNIASFKVADKLRLVHLFDETVLEEVLHAKDPNSRY